MEIFKKWKLIGMIACLSIPGVAAAQSVDAPGNIFYQMPSGEIVTRDATLRVPARGIGNVELIASGGSFVAERFFSREANGRTVFYVVFADYPGASEDDRAVYRGTYVRGSNLALYYGDVFVTDHRNCETDAAIESLFGADSAAEFDDATYVAGFSFSATIN
jgi:hypothetical protein